MGRSSVMIPASQVCLITSLQVTYRVRLLCRPRTEPLSAYRVYALQAPLTLPAADFAEVCCAVLQPTNAHARASATKVSRRVSFAGYSVFLLV